MFSEAQTNKQKYSISSPASIDLSGLNIGGGERKHLRFPEAFLIFRLFTKLIQILKLDRCRFSL